MNYKFLPFAIGMALASTATNAETFEELNVEGETNLKGGVAIGGSKASDRTLLDISIPKGAETSSLIYSCDLNLPTNNTIFEVSNKGELKCQDWTVTEKNVGGQYTGRLICAYDKDEGGFKFSTHGYNRNYPISFNATQFNFDGGDMVVNGKITCKDELNVVALNAKDINVEMNNAADYVFDENYDLKSLSEVESYVNEHKHLPGIPSAADMAENGMSVAAMSNMLLEKVEELTLHMIRLEKENAALKAEVKSLKK